ncbi:LAME_0H06150g1_1 [Lachancea meyersii CBS 8951]|uniref:LAME_0H06150g1_1 n=1 Tax=Lachancea meyersii CBS 8951 TaxID=1266667 RepID=A0A1G4KEF9_9SACH|nr:LAME_0H06150g1_1 [Lachancea meyersii CBS 8951]
MPQIQIQSELCSKSREISSNLDWKHLCEKLSQLSGVLPSDMELEFKFRNGTSKTVTNPSEKDGLFVQDLGQEPFQIQIKDLNADSLANQLAQDFVRTENEEKSSPLFTLSEEDYKNRMDSVLQWKKDQGLGSYDPEYRAKLEQELQRQQDWAQRLTLNERCSVTTHNGNYERRGWLRFIGQIPAVSKEPKLWCGVEFDEPFGKNDGTVDGHVMFGPVKPQYGGFVTPTTVRTSSEYQPLDLGLESDDDDDEL